jgi:hypothetical protein
MSLRIDVHVYLDTEHAPRGLVTVTEFSSTMARPIQTVGSALIGSEELTTMMLAAVYTLNSVK